MNAAEIRAAVPGERYRDEIVRTELVELYEAVREIERSVASLHDPFVAAIRDKLADDHKVELLSAQAAHVARTLTTVSARLLNAASGVLIYALDRQSDRIAAEMRSESLGD